LISTQTLVLCRTRVLSSVLSEMPSVLYYESFGRAYNMWRDKCAEFRAEYADHEEFSTVVNAILELLNNRLSDDSTDQFHPFHRYADADKTGLENFHTLALDTAQAVQTPRLRQYAHSFFHSGGTNYPEMLELLDEYLLFADRAEDPDWSEDDESSDDDESEGDEESVIDLTGDDDEELGAPVFDPGAPSQNAAANLNNF
jgi:hypothetical protein